MNLEESRTPPRVVVRVIAEVVNSHSQTDGWKRRQQPGELKELVSPTNLNRLELVEDEGLLGQDGDRELDEDPFVMI